MSTVIAYAWRGAQLRIWREQSPFAERIVIWTMHPPDRRNNRAGERASLALAQAIVNGIGALDRAEILWKPRLNQGLSASSIRAQTHPCRTVRQHSRIRR